MILLDTNILIEILKGNRQTEQEVAGLRGPLSVSTVSVMELMYGARDKGEVLRIQQFVQLFEQLPLSEAISTAALRLVTDYAKSHGLDIPDALIAATAIEHRASLLTYNLKDFRFIPGLALVR